MGLCNVPYEISMAVPLQGLKTAVSVNRGQLDNCSSVSSELGRLPTVSRNIASVRRTSLRLLRVTSRIDPRTGTVKDWL